MKTLTAILAATFTLCLLTSFADARGRTGSTRSGGYNSHGKGSHYYGGH